MSARASDEAIRFHYDVGTDFYALWLDPTLTYSAALFPTSERERDERQLPTAQLAKLDYAAQQSGAPGRRRVLDIGCGWGSGLERLVAHHGVKHAVGLTLSEQQMQHIRTKGDPRISVELASFEDHRPDTRYGAAISIGAFEHFARPKLEPPQKVAAYRRFFEACHRLLEPGAGLYLQTIAYGDAEPEETATFLQRHIFPESDLPRLWEICQAADRLFDVRTLHNHAEHYERTVKCWDRALRARSEEAASLTSAELVKRYSRYLRLAAIGFHQGTLALYRITLRRLP